MVIFFTAAVHGADSGFGPWGSDLKTGDGRKAVMPLMRTDACPVHGYAKSVIPVYNGFQGGAYLMIRFFQEVISPQDGPNCRFRPTCSQYGLEAVWRYGALLGSFLAGERLLRCNPYYPPGNDPVPDSLF